MEITHGIALFFSVVFIVLAMLFQKALWWLVSIFYLVACAWMAVTNGWEMLFFAPLLLFSIISLVGFITSAVKGDLI